METRDYLIILYDYYSELLNDDNKKYFEDYYFDNLSLGEIAENNNISRNAIHKHIKSTENKLLFYEVDFYLNVLPVGSIYRVECTRVSKGV